MMFYSVLKHMAPFWLQNTIQGVIIIKDIEV